MSFAVAHRPAIRHSQSHSHSHVIRTPQLRLSMDILQLPACELDQRLSAESLENPALEIMDLGCEFDELGGGDDGRCDSNRIDHGHDRTQTIQEQERELVSSTLSNLLDSDEVFTPRRSANQKREDADRHSAMVASAPQRPLSLDEYLREQLSLRDFEEDQKSLANQIIDNLDDRGFLTGDIRELESDSLGFNRALQLVQQLDPPGVAARDLRECLLLQVSSDSPNASVTRRIIIHHLQDLKTCGLRGVAKKSGLSLDTVEQAVEDIRHMTRDPAAMLSQDTANPVFPDAIAKPLIDGSLAVETREYKSLRVDPSFESLVDDTSDDQATQTYIAEKINAVKNLVHALEFRGSTLQRVAQIAINKQRGFFESGNRSLQPLTLDAVADETGLSRTTVWRAIEGKWIETPAGTFPLKSFFHRQATQNGDGAVSPEAVKAELRTVLNSENKQSPLSDTALASEMERRGLPIARRTVAKYRKVMGFESVHARRA